MTFHAWWALEVGRPPEDEVEKQAFRLAKTAWDAAVAAGAPDIEPEQVDAALARVGSGGSTRDDEILLRWFLGAANETVSVLQAELAKFQAYQENARGAGVPEGATPMGGNVWRCPRCNRINGIRNPVSECRRCAYPEADSRVVAEES